MGQYLKTAYERALKPAVRIITVPFIIPTLARRRIERLTQSQVYYSPYDDYVLNAGIDLGLAFNLVSLIPAMMSFSEGRTLEGLAFLISPIANGISGAYEAGRRLIKKHKASLKA